MKNKKIILGLSASLLIVSLFTTGCGKEVNISKKAAVGFENGEITANDFYKEIKKDNISILIDLLDHKILDEKYPSDDLENEDVKGQIKTLKENISSSYGDDSKEKFETVIKQYFGVDSEKELESMLRLEYKRDQAVNEYVESKLDKGEIKKYYEDKIYGKMGAKHILITVDASEDASDEEKAEAEETAKKKAENIIKKLDEGKSFESAAKKYSKDESTAQKGGDLGTFEYESMVEEFSKACYELKVNEYTKEPVKTQYGYHIILKTSQEDKPKEKEVKDQIKQILRAQKLDEDKTLYFESLKAVREEAGMTWNDSKLKKAYNEYMDKLIENAKGNEQ